ncbi:MAG: hypothetical protein QM681_19650 [Novosphingobium sp.]
MILAQLHVHGGGGRKIKWGLHKFAALPSPGDLVEATGPDGKLHYLTVRHTEFGAVPADSVEEPQAIVVTDWKVAYEG